jgi:toxin YoeB
MEIIYSDNAEKDLAYWNKHGTQSDKNKIKTLLQSMSETPFDGVGKPEALKYDLSGYWSRRIDKKHRIIYRVMSDRIEIVSFREHCK